MSSWKTTVNSCDRGSMAQNGRRVHPDWFLLCQWIHLWPWAWDSNRNTSVANTSGYSGFGLNKWSQTLVRRPQICCWVTLKGVWGMDPVSECLDFEFVYIFCCGCYNSSFKSNFVLNESHQCKICTSFCLCNSKNSRSGIISLISLLADELPSFLLLHQPKRGIYIHISPPCVS